MDITLLTGTTCPVDGLSIRGRLWRGYRINKRSMRSTDTPGLGWQPRECPECRHPVAADSFETVAIDPTDLARIEAYRRKRWPALAPALPDTTSGETRT
jgi:hypothetical protein